MIRDEGLFGNFSSYQSALEECVRNQSGNRTNLTRREQRRQRQAAAAALRAHSVRH